MDCNGITLCEGGMDDARLTRPLNPPVRTPGRAG